MELQRRERQHGYAPEGRRGVEDFAFRWTELTGIEKAARQNAHTKKDQCVETIPVGHASVSRPKIDPEIESKFLMLRDRWLVERGPESSTTRLVLNPAYQGIIGMGPVVVPLLLRELESRVDEWFWALHAITQVDPCDEEDQGDWEAMANAWIDWGKGQGYNW